MKAFKLFVIFAAVVLALGTALAADAECLVTGDKDLLSLKRYQDVLVLSPRAFYDRLKQS